MIGIVYWFSQNQDSRKQNSLQLNWGVATLQIQNLTASPMIHKSWSGVNAFLQYIHSKKLYHHFYFKFSQHKVQVGNPFEWSAIFNGDKFVSSVPHQFLLAAINYSLGKTVFHSSKLRLVIGARFRNCFSQTYCDFGPIGSGFWYFTFRLDAWLNFTYNLSKKHQFATNLALPTPAWVTRAPYLTVDGK